MELFLECSWTPNVFIGTCAKTGYEKQDPKQEERKTMLSVLVGGKAPDFQAPAYYKGSFTTVKLSDFLGKWVMLCFYPGDFTFV